MGRNLVAGEALNGPAGPKLRRYADMLLEQADRLGLTSLRDVERILQELVVDSLAALDWIPTGSRVLDLGSGGGCPGIPLAISREDSQFTLVEANQRKAGFLREVCEQLELKHVVVLSQRSEDLAQHPKHRACYSRVVAKAVAAMPTLLELSIPFLELQGSLIAYKGPSVKQEIEISKLALFELKAKVVRTVPYSNGERSLLLCEVRKQAPTPARYPRRPGMPGKEPLGVRLPEAAVTPGSPIEG